MEWIVAKLVASGLSQQAAERIAKIGGRLVALLLVFALLTALWVRGEHFRDQRDTARAQVTAAQAQLGKQIADYRAAYQAAMVKALTRKFAEDRRTQDLKEKADEQLDRQASDFRARGAAYALAHGVVRGQAGPAQAGDGDSGRSTVPGAAAAAPLDHGPGDAAELVAVSRADFDVCSDNSGRILNAHDWGAGLQAKPAP